MIGFLESPYGDANHHIDNPIAAPASNKRLASTREELERSWHSSGTFSTSARAQVLHSISCSESLDEIEGGRSFKRQRTNESVDASMFVSGVTINPVSGLRIAPDNRPPKSGGVDMRSPQDNNAPSIKAGWYQGQVDYMGNRHGKGHTKHDDGTEYEGDYVNDLMEGWGKYRFTTMKQLVSFPASAMSAHMHSPTLHRVTDKVFEGLFIRDEPVGRGILTTTIVDSVPERVASSGIDIKYAKIMHDVGFYKADGKPVGEGARFTYSRTTTTGWEEVCTRLHDGQCTGVKTDRSYATWVCDCLGLPYPKAPSI